MKIAANGLCPHLVLLSGGILCLFLSLSLSSFAGPEAATPTAKPTSSVQVSFSPSPTIQEENLNKSAGESADQRFRELRRQRRDLISKSDDIKGDIESLQTNLAGLKAKEASLQQQIEGLPSGNENEITSEIEKAKSALSDLKSKGKAEGQSTEDYNRAISNTAGVIGFYQSQLRGIQSAAVRKPELQKQLDDTKSDRQRIEHDLSDALVERNKLATEQSENEDEINGLLIPETEQNQFKFTTTVAFSLLVLIVIAGFFVISWKDQVVRQAIFSGQSGCSASVGMTI